MFDNVQDKLSDLRPCFKDSYSKSAQTSNHPLWLDCIYPHKGSIPQQLVWSRVGIVRDGNAEELLVYRR